MYDNEICGVDCGEDSQNRLNFRVFRLISAIFLGFQSASDSVIRWFESSYPSHFGIIRTSSLFVGCSDYFCIWTISADGKARRDAIAPWANDRYSVGLRPPYGLFFMIEDFKNFTK